MKKVIVWAVMLVALAAMGCGSEESTADLIDLGTDEAREWTPEELGKLGAELEANPASIEEILEEHGLTLEIFEAEIRRVSENPGKARRYAEAYRSAAS